MPNQHEAFQHNPERRDYFLPEGSGNFVQAGSFDSKKSTSLQAFIAQLRDAHRYVNNRRNAIDRH